MFNLNDLGYKPRLCMIQQRWKFDQKMKPRRTSHTPGKEKVETCQTNTMKSYLSKHGRASGRNPQHPQYHDYCLGKGVFAGIGWE